MMIELAVEFTRSFGAPEMAQMMEGVERLIAVGMIASVLIGTALGLIIALFRQALSASFASADRDSGLQARGWDVGEHSDSTPARVNETAALAAIAAALEAPARVNETAALAAVAAALEVPARPGSAGGYLKTLVVVIILAIIIGLAIVDDQQVRQDTNGHGSDQGKIEFKPEATVQPLTGRQAAEGASKPVGDQQVRQNVPKAPVLVKPPTVIEPTPQGILPPVQYDRPYESDLTIEIVATAEELRMRCKIYDLRVLGCAFPKEVLHDHSGRR